jgi:lipoate-protein ligase A
VDFSSGLSAFDLLRLGPLSPPQPRSAPYRNMTLCDITLSSPEENLALDEALLEACEEDGADETLRFWEPQQYFVVVGYANATAKEVNLSFCEANEIPVLRRFTGGGTVLQGPGCLNYSLILRIREDGPLRTISGTNQFILSRHQLALTAPLEHSVEMRGQTDLTVEELKFSGNAQRRKKSHLIFHGSFLLDFHLEMIGKALPMPSKEPDYRHGRAHSDFLTNLNVPTERIKEALIKAWNATDSGSDIPLDRVQSLVREKYSRAEWNRKF